VSGFTSKGRMLVRYYVQHARYSGGFPDDRYEVVGDDLRYRSPEWQRMSWEYAPLLQHKNFATIEVLALPERLITMWPTHPDVRAYVLEELMREPFRTPGRRR
jgi:hypothetical protein